MTMASERDVWVKVSMLAFKGEDELYSAHNETMEVTDATVDDVEIAFDHIRNERIYLRFSLADLVRAAHRFGRVGG
jgi:hypothetical protein